MEPKQLAYMCRNTFGVEHIQFTWDLIDPWWPEVQRDLLVKEYSEAFAAEGLKIDATFGGGSLYLSSICWHRRKFIDRYPFHFSRELLI